MPQHFAFVGRLGPVKFRIEYVLIDVLAQHLEGLLDIGTRFCTDLDKTDAISSGQLLGCLLGHSPAPLEVSLGADQYLADLLGGVGLDLGHPSLDIGEGQGIGYGIGQDNTRSALVVGLCDVLETLLAGGVPDLHFESFVAQGQGFHLEVHADRGHVGVLEGVLAEAGNQVGLADAAVPDHDHLHQVILLCRCHGLIFGRLNKCSISGCISLIINPVRQSAPLQYCFYSLQLQLTAMNAHLFKTRASTLQKIAELPRYRHPADLVTYETRPVRQQRLEIDGQLEFGKNLYFSLAQEALVKGLLQTRTGFRGASVKDRTGIATSEYQMWSKYLQEQVNNLPESSQIKGDKKQKVYESYLIAKQRNHEKMQLARTIRLCERLGTGFRFDIDIHPLALIRMIYPRYGYLNNYTEQRLNFEDYIRFLEQMVAVSAHFDKGSHLHGYQLLSFVFWKAYTKNASMSTADFCRFLANFKFTITPDSLAKDLEYHLRQRKGELVQDSPVRFDLWRGIFLERGL